jgi:hypothetical protein
MKLDSQSASQPASYSDEAHKIPQKLHAREQGCTYQNIVTFNPLKTNPVCFI